MTSPSVRTNEVMKVLMIVGTVFILLTPCRRHGMNSHA
jgi:hypothetical protein